MRICAKEFEKLYIFHFLDLRNVRSWNDVQVASQCVLFKDAIIGDPKCILVMVAI